MYIFYIGHYYQGYYNNFNSGYGFPPAMGGGGSGIKHCESMQETLQT